MKTVAYHQLTDAQGVPKQPAPLANLLPSLFLSMMSHGMGDPFGLLGSAVPAVSPPSFLRTLSILSGGIV